MSKTNVKKTPFFDRSTWLRCLRVFAVSFCILGAAEIALALFDAGKDVRENVIFVTGAVCGCYYQMKLGNGGSK